MTCGVLKRGSSINYSFYIIYTLHFIPLILCFSIHDLKTPHILKLKQIWFKEEKKILKKISEADWLIVIIRLLRDAFAQIQVQMRPYADVNSADVI